MCIFYIQNMWIVDQVDPPVKNSYADKKHLTQPTITCLKSTIKKTAMSEICSKFTIKAGKQRQWSRSIVFIINFEQI